MKDTIFYGFPGAGDPHFSAGTWTLTKTGNILSWDKTAADNTSVVTLTVPRFNQGAGFGGRVKRVGVLYSVATAALDAAPTIDIDKLTQNQTTKVVSRDAVTETGSVAGSDTTGTAAGTYAVIATIADADLVSDDENVELQVQATFDAGATTVLKVFGLEVEYV